MNRYVSRPAYTCVCAAVVRLECMWLYKWLDTLSASLPAKNCFHLTRFFALIEILQHNELLPKTYSTPKSVYKS